MAELGTVPQVQPHTPTFEELELRTQFIEPRVRAAEGFSNSKIPPIADNDMWDLASRAGEYTQQAHWDYINRAFVPDSERFYDEEEFKTFIGDRSSIKYTAGISKKETQTEMLLHDVTAYRTHLKSKGIDKPVAEFVAGMLPMLLSPEAFIGMGLAIASTPVLTAIGVGARWAGAAGFFASGKGRIAAGVIDTAVSLIPDKKITEGTGQREFTGTDMLVTLMFGAAFEGVGVGVRRAINGPHVDIKTKEAEAQIKLADDIRTAVRGVDFVEENDPVRVIQQHLAGEGIEASEGQIIRVLDEIADIDPPKAAAIRGQTSAKGQAGEPEPLRKSDDLEVIRTEMNVKTRDAATDFTPRVATDRQWLNPTHKGYTLKFDNEFDHALYAIGNGDRVIEDQLMEHLIDTGVVAADTKQSRSQLKRAAKEIHKLIDSRYDDIPARTAIDGKISKVHSQGSALTKSTKVGGLEVKFRSVASKLFYRATEPGTLKGAQAVKRLEKAGFSPEDIATISARVRGEVDAQIQLSGKKKGSITVSAAVTKTMKQATDVPDLTVDHVGGIAKLLDMVRYTDESVVRSPRTALGDDIAAPPDHVPESVTDLRTHKSLKAEDDEMLKRVAKDPETLEGMEAIDKAIADVQNQLDSPVCRRG